MKKTGSSQRILALTENQQNRKAEIASSKPSNGSTGMKRRGSLVDNNVSNEIKVVEFKI